jgi:hypothetical protein
MDIDIVTESVAGIATAGTALSRALFELAGAVDESPAEMTQIAQCMIEMSVAFRQLTRIIGAYKRVCRNRLLRGLDLIVGQVEKLQDEICDVVKSTGSRLDRVMTMFQTSHVTNLLEQARGYKTTIQLMATIVLLGDSEKVYAETRFVAGSWRWRRKSLANVFRDGGFIYPDLAQERTGLRKEAESLVRAVAQCVRAMSRCQQERSPAMPSVASPTLSVPDLSNEVMIRYRPMFHPRG